MIQFQTLLIISFFLNFAYAISEADCKSVDLREPGKPMHGSPTFDQRSTSYCWAFAGTQLATSIVQKQNLKTFNYDPASLPISPTVTMNRATLQAPDCPLACEIVNKVLKSRSACSYQDVTIEISGTEFHPDTGEKISGNLGPQCAKTTRLREIEDDLQAVIGKYQFEISGAIDLSSKNPKANSLQRQKSLTRFLQKRMAVKNLKLGDIYNATVAPKCMDLENVNAPFVGSRAVNDVLKTVQPNHYSCESYQSQFFNSVIEDQFPECPKIPAARILDSKALVRKVNDLFNSGADAPVAIDYCYDFLHDGVQNKRPIKSLCTDSGGDSTMDHKSLLIGRRFNPKSKQCEFLLRNTLGRNCNSLHALYRQSCEEELKNHQAADTWIPAETLEQVVHGMSVVRESK